MKNKNLFFSSLLLLFCINISSKDIPASESSNGKDSLSILSSPDLYDLSALWAREFNIVNPSAKIKVERSPVANSSEIGLVAKLGFVSHEFYSSGSSESAWMEVVGRDVLVPVINSKNPFIEEIYKYGISSEKLVRIFTHPDNRNWSTLVENAKNVPVNYYAINDVSIKLRIKNFLESDQIPVEGTMVYDSKEIIAAISNDPYALGFCKLADIMESGNLQLAENIILMPIDRNFNGKMDYNEKIYEDLNTFTRGIWIGKYPKTLYSNIYVCSGAQPSDETEVGFLKWVYTDGQKFISQYGYSDLALNERKASVDELVVSSIDLTVQKADKSQLKLILLILGCFVVLSIILDAGISYIKNKKIRLSLTNPLFKPVMNENSVIAMNGLYFGKTHTWAFMKENGLVKLGIDDFLQHVTGTITQLKMKMPGDKITKGETLLSIIHEGKHLNINSPVSGIIKEQNGSLNCHASVINSSPYSEGWVYMVEPTNWIREIQFLLLGKQYSNWLKDEFSRLRDFLSVYAKPGTLDPDYVILQDGGEISDNPLSNLGPEIWEEFQINFIDNSK